MGLVVDSYRFAAAAAFDAFTDIAWDTVAYAEDPAESPTDGGLLTGWNNAGTGGGTFTVAGSGNAPTWRASVTELNGQPGFDHTTKDLAGLTKSSVSISVPWSMVAVGSMKTTYRTEPYILTWNTTGLGRHSPAPDDWQIREGSFQTFGTADADPHLWVLVAKSAGGIDVYKDGTLYSLSNGSATTQFILDNRCAGYYSFGGVVSGEFTSTEIANIESWAGTKYGLTIA
jgi:hypothetical protein